MASRAFKSGGRKGRNHKRPRQTDTKYTKAGPVTVITKEGEVSTAKAYSPSEYRQITKVRWKVSEGQRHRILKRDRGTCRYCGNPANPAHIDHVVPVALGGSNTMRNLVTSCDTCNLRKGANVWKPRPLSTIRPAAKRVTAPPTAGKELTGQRAGRQHGNRDSKRT